MKLWTRSRDTDAADVDVNKQMKEETTRRKWCIEQAALVKRCVLKSCSRQRCKFTNTFGGNDEHSLEMDSADSVLDSGGVGDARRYSLLVEIK